MTSWTRTRYYDIGLDCDAQRITGYDGRGGSFWTTVPLSQSGATRRATLDEALFLIEDAINAGDPPGEVTKPAKATYR